jgi:hypothetical protein
VEEVAETDRVRVPVARVHEHRELRVGELHPLRDGHRPPVDRVEGVHVQVLGHAAVAADAGDRDDFLTPKT